MLKELFLTCFSHAPVLHGALGKQQPLTLHGYS